MKTSEPIESLESRIVLSAFPFGTGSSGIDYGTGTATDAGGNIYVTGTFQGKVDFDPGRHTAFLNAEGQGSAFVAKYDRNGGFLWAKKLGSQTIKIASSPVGVSGRIAVDSAGEVYVTGMFNATSDFHPSNGILGDAFLVKLSTSGKVLWERGLGGIGLDAGFGIAVDKRHIYLTGTYSLSADFDPTSGTATLTSKGLLDVFVAKYSKGGHLLFARGVGGPGLEAGFGVAVSTKTGQFYITGTTTSDSLSFYDTSGGSSTILHQSGKSGAFVIKVTAGGHLGFAKVLAGGSKSFAEGLSIAVDPGNDLFLCGAFSGTVDFDPGSGTANLTPVQATDGFLTKLSGGAGYFLITKRVGGPDDNSLNDVKITSSGDVYTVGFYNAPHVTVSGSGSATAASQGGAGIFLGKFRISGGFIKSRGYGGGYDDWGTAVALDESRDDIYFTGFVDAVTGNEKDFQFVNITTGGNAALYRVSSSLAPA